MQCNDNISVIIPMHNAEMYIERCITSVLKCINDGDEIVIINDGSTDNSLSICSKLQIERECIRVINQNNLGVGSARNKGILSALNKWITFVDADDFVDIDGFRKIKEYLDDDYDLLMFEHVNEDRKNFFQNDNKEYYFDNKNFDKLIEMSLTSSENNEIGQIDMRSVWGNFYKKDFLINKELYFDCELQIGEDLLFLLKVYLNIAKAACICIPIYHYYFKNEGSLTNKYKPELESNIHYLNNEIRALLLNDDKYINWYSFYVLNDVIILMKYVFFNASNPNKMKDKYIKLKKYLVESKYAEYYKDVCNSGMINRYNIFKRILFWCAHKKYIFLLYVFYVIRY